MKFTFISTLAIFQYVAFLLPHHYRQASTILVLCDDDVPGADGSDISEESSSGDETPEGTTAVERMNPILRSGRALA